MSSTDKGVAQDIAAAQFDEVVTPLAEARKAAGKPGYFPLGAEPDATSYFESPTVRAMQPIDFEFPGGGTSQGLIDALAARWTAEGDLGLAGMAPALKEIAAALADEAAEGDGTVSILCYTMF